MTEAQEPNFEHAFDCVVTKMDGESCQFKQLLEKDQKYLIFLTRHFGCISCSELVSNVLKYKSELLDSGLHLIFVGNGNYKELTKFVKRMDLVDDKFYTVTDKSLEIYKKLGLEYSILSTVNSGSLTSAMRAFREGHRNERTGWGAKGSHFQQGGVVMLDSSHNVNMYYRSKFLGDNPQEAVLLFKAQNLK